MSDFPRFVRTAVAGHQYQFQVPFTVAGSSAPLLNAGDVAYIGSFRVPRTQGEADTLSFSFGGDAPCFSAEGTLYLVGHINQQRVAEISIPTPVISGTIADLPTATRVQQFGDITNGFISTSLGDGLTGAPKNRIGGMVDLGDGRLLVNLYVNYDGSGLARKSFCFCNKTLSTPSATGIYALSPDTSTGHSAGYITPIPASVQASLGKTHWACLTNLASIVSRLCFPPGAIGFNAADLGATPANRIQYADYYATPGAGYPGTTWNWFTSSGDGQNQNYNAASNATGMIYAIRSAKAGIIAFGSRGTGKIWYGQGTKDFTNITSFNQSPADLNFVKSLGLCVDPYQPLVQGLHAESYKPTMWFYDPADFLAVKNGTKVADTVTPYLVADLPTPYTNIGIENIGGACYDATTGKVYVSERGVDGTSKYPLIHVYQLPT